MSTNAKLKVVSKETKPLDSMTIEEIIGRPVFRQKLTPPQFKEDLVDFSNPKHLANALDKLSQEDDMSNGQ